MLLRYNEASMERGTASPGVLVAEDHPLVRRMLARVIRDHPGLEVVGQAATGGEALAKAARIRPAIVLLDIDMPGKGGLEVLADLARDRADTRVVIFSACASAAVAHRALAAGAAGYLAKDEANDADLCEALLVVAGGQTVVSPGLQRSIVVDIRERPAGWLPLADRELETLRLAAEGCSNTAIAQRLHLSVSSVKTYLRRAVEKLGCRNVTAAAVEGARRNLL